MPSLYSGQHYLRVWVSDITDVFEVHLVTSRQGEEEVS